MFLLKRARLTQSTSKHIKSNTFVQFRTRQILNKHSTGDMNTNSPVPAGIYIKRSGPAQLCGVGAIIRLPKKAGRVKLYIGANIGTMEIAGPGISSSSDHLSTRSIAHIGISIKLRRSTSFRTIYQRMNQIKALHIDRKGREYLQVLERYLQVSASTYRGTPARGTHTHILSCQQQGSIGISGEAYSHTSTKEI
jgi:hypothetical protein